MHMGIEKGPPRISCFPLLRENVNVIKTNKQTNKQKLFFFEIKHKIGAHLKERAIFDVVFSF